MLKFYILTVSLLVGLTSGFELTVPSNPNQVDLVFRSTNTKSRGFYHPSLSPLQAITTCFWFNTSSSNRNHVHIHYENYAYHVASDSSSSQNRIHVYINSKNRTLNVPSLLHDGVWHHLCTTWDGLTGKLHVYIDGTLQASHMDQDMKGRLLLESLTITLGIAWNGTFVNKDKFEGDMSQVNIWKFVRDFSDIARMSLSCNNNEEGNLYAWKTFVGRSWVSMNVTKRNSTCPLAKGRDCVDLLRKGHRITGFYLINPDGKGYFTCACDQQTNGGGWTVIQRRFDQSVNFDNKEPGYNDGFGNPEGEFWFGNKRIHRLASTYTHLLMELMYNGVDVFQLYKVQIGGSSLLYRLFLHSNRGRTSTQNYCFKPSHFSNFCYRNCHNGGFWVHVLWTWTCNLNAFGSSGYNMYFENRWFKSSQTEIKTRTLRERNNEFAMSFEDASSKLYYPRVKGFITFTVCAWIKTTLNERLQCLFSFYNEDQRFQICFNSTKVLVFLINDKRSVTFTFPPLSSSHWTHMCLTKDYSGIGNFYLNGMLIETGWLFQKYVNFNDGSLIIGQKQDSTRAGVDPLNGFVGHLSQFRMWAISQSDKVVASLNSKCIDDYGVIPWPEAFLFISGNVKMYNVTFCKDFKVGHQWNLVLSEQSKFQDLPHRDQLFAVHSDNSSSMGLNVFSHEKKDSCVELMKNTHYLRCWHEPRRCLQGFTVSFLLKFGDQMISRILDKQPEERKRLESFLSPIVSSKSKWALCYRASRDSWNPQAFHTNCDNKSPTLTIVKVKDYIFGGYTDKYWGGSASDTSSSDKSFLFSLKNPSGCGAFKVDLKAGHSAIRKQPYLGPVFGKDDLHLGAVSFSDLGVAYDISNISCQSSNSREEARRILAGSYYFSPDDIEVFEYIEPVSSTMILSGCRLSFYQQDNDYEIEVFALSSTYWRYHLRVPIAKRSMWTHIVITWSETFGIRFIQDGVEYDFSSTMEYKTPSCRNAKLYTLVVGCTYSSRLNVEHTMNFQLTDITLWSSALPIKEASIVSRETKDFYKTAQVLNVAYKKKATAFPSTANHLRAVDGKSTTWSAGYCIDINNIKIRPWLEIDLEQEYLISDIFISVYKYGINDKRLYLQNFEIIISNETGNVNGSKCGEDLTLYKQSHGRFYCQDRPRGRYVRIASTLQNDKVESFGICEVEVEVLQVPGYWNATTAFPNYKGKKEFYRTGFVVNSRNCLSFSYLFNGSDPGRLNVNFSGAETLLWRFTGHHENNRWSIAQVPINADIAYQIIFEAVVGDNGYIGVDNVILSNEENCSFVPKLARNQVLGMTTNMIGHINTYQDWLLPTVAAQAGIWNKYFKPCYHALTDGWNASMLLQKCSKKGPLIFLVRKESLVFGGFTDVNHLNDYLGLPKDYALKRSTSALRIHRNVREHAASRAVDGNINTLTRTEHDDYSWWSVKLDRAVFISKIYIYRHNGRLSPFHINISHGANVTRCGSSGLTLLRKAVEGWFHCNPPIYGDNVTLHLELLKPHFIQIAEVQVYGYEGVPSSKAFLFILKHDSPGAQMDLLPNRHHTSVFFTEDGIIFGEGDLFINITERTVRFKPGISYQAFADDNIYKAPLEADDIEVLALGDYFSQLPCVEGEIYDEIVNKCKCDFGRRDYEVCVQRRELQNKRDAYCKDLIVNETSYARFDRKRSVLSLQWSCYAESALIGDRRRFNVSKKSNKILKDNQLTSIQSENYPYLIIDDVLKSKALSHWPMDNKNDLKCLKTGLWTYANDSANVNGVKGGALRFAGNGSMVKLPTRLNTFSCLFNPNYCDPNGITVSMWIKIHQSVHNDSQVFWTSQETPKSTGYSIFQPQSTSNISVSVTDFDSEAIDSVAAPLNIWFFFLFNYDRCSDSACNFPKIYINGKLQSNGQRNYVDKKYFPGGKINYTSIGQIGAGLPNASIDEIVIYTGKTSFSNFYNYYKGGPNLHLDATLLTQESWDSELLNRNSQTYSDTFSNITQAITSADVSNNVKNYSKIRFWDQNGFVAFNILIAFNGKDYSSINDVVVYLEQNYTILNYSSNDVFIRRLAVSSYDVNGTLISLSIKWSTEKTLYHGIFMKYTITYQKADVMSSALKYKYLYRDELGDTLNYVLNVSDYYTNYSIWVRADTHEGEGRESEKIVVRTNASGPLVAPQKVKGFNKSSQSIKVTWISVPSKYRRGPVTSYLIKYRLSDSSEPEANKSESTTSTLLEGLQKYSNYTIQVCGVSIENHLGPCELIHVWTDEDVPGMTPQNVSVKAVNATSANITWDEIPEGYRFGVIVHCSLMWTKSSDVSSKSQVFIESLKKPAVGFLSTIIKIPPNPMMYLLSGLESYTSYQVQLACSTRIGSGNYSSPVTFYTGEGVPDKAPNISESYNTSSTSIYIAWTPIPQENVRGILKGYMVIFNDTSGVENVVFVCNNSFNVTKNDLKKYERYEVSLSGFTREGLGVLSQPYVITTDEDAPESGVENLTTAVVQANSLVLSLSPPSPENANGVISGYLITKYDKLRNITTNITVNATQKQLILDSMKPFTDYNITVTPFNKKGIGKPTTINVKTQEAAPSAPPSNVLATTTSGASISVSWDAVDSLHVNGKVRFYVIVYYKLSAPEIKYNVTIRVKDESSKTRRKRRAIDSHVLTGLAPYTEYGVQVLAVTVADGVPSIQFNVTSGQTAPSFYPLNLHAHNTSSTSLLVRWDEVPDEHKNGIITKYEISYTNEYDKASQIEAVNNGSLMSTTLSGLKKYERYHVKVRAFTVIGPGNWSLPVTARTGEDVPDGYPVNITATATLTTFTVKWDVMAKRQENGIIQGYHAAAFMMNGTQRSMTTVYGQTTAVIRGLDIWVNYTVQVRGFTSVGNGGWSPSQLYTTDEQAPQDVPTEVKAQFISSTSIRVQWNPINASITRGIPRGYNIYYRALKTPFSRRLHVINASVDAVSADLSNLYKYVEYAIYIKAKTNKEGNQSQTVKTYTDEDKPDKPPSALYHRLPSPDSIWIEWREVPYGYANGIILGYKMTIQNTKKPGSLTTKTYRAGTFSTTFFGLPSYVTFEITLSAFTVKGDGPPLIRAIRTDENVPDQYPQNLKAESFTSSNSLPVSWDPIPEGGVPGILLGFRLWYTPVAKGDDEIEDGARTQIKIPPTQTRVVLQNLDINTQYRIEIAGRTTKGDGPAAVTLGETCRCKKRFSSSWISFPPYVEVTSDGSVTGIMPNVVKEMVKSCCQECKSHGWTYLDLKLDGYNQTAQKYSQSELKVMIDGETDIIFPIPGYKSQRMYKKPYAFKSLVETPGIAFVITTRVTEGVLTQNMIQTIWKSWPLVLFSFIFAFIVGCFIWMFEVRINEEQFPKSYIKGVMEGFWFTFVSMTTVGYGDRCPSSICGRILAIFWTLFGVVLTGMIIGNIIVAITTVAVTQASTLYGMKVGAMRNSFEYRFGIRRNAKMNKVREYQSYDQIYEDLEKGLIEGALLDSFALGSRKDLFNKPFIRLKTVYDISFANGVVSTGNSSLMNTCFRRYTRSMAKMISDTVKSKAHAIEVNVVPLASEMSSGIFDTSSSAYKNLVMISGGALAFLVVLGLIWHVIYSVKKTDRSPDFPRQELVERLKKMNALFYKRFSLVIQQLKEKHQQERQQLQQFERTRLKEEERMGQEKDKEELKSKAKKLTKYGFLRNEKPIYEKRYFFPLEEAKMPVSGLSLFDKKPVFTFDQFAEYT